VYASVLGSRPKYFLSSSTASPWSSCVRRSWVPTSSMLQSNEGLAVSKLKFGQRGERHAADVARCYIGVRCQFIEELLVGIVIPRVDVCTR
jgi:hypothetical protein